MVNKLISKWQIQPLCHYNLSSEKMKICRRNKKKLTVKKSKFLSSLSMNLSVLPFKNCQRIAGNGSRVCEVGKNKCRKIKLYHLIASLINTTSGINVLSVICSIHWSIWLLRKVSFMALRVG